MQTIKTGVVVALLLAVCYGAFVALNAPEPDLPDELLSDFDWSSDEAGLDALMDIQMPPGEGLSALDVSAPATTAAGIQASGGRGTLDVANLALPNLPALGPSTGAMTGQGMLPATQTAPGTETAATTSGAALSGLPPLPVTGGDRSPGADGPAVSLNGPKADTETPAASPAVSGESPSSSSSISASGQLVSQTRVATTPDAAGIQLPLLNGPTAPASPGPASKEQPTKEQPMLPFATARQQAIELASSGKLRDALQMLSGYYNSPELNTAQHSDLVDLLDALSREVIYSPRHLAEPPYTVTAADTIESLATKYQITPELFAAINRLGASKALVDGSQVKVLPGPFRAEVSLGKQELTVFMGELYAGRFPVAFGKDPSPVEGTFEIVDRRRDRTYYGTGGKVIAADDSRNPYGGYWLNLGQDLCIHGTAEMSSDDLQDAGCISLAPLDAADVYTILAQSSQVTIVR